MAGSPARSAKPRIAVFIMILPQFYEHGDLILKQQRSELIQAAAPGLPLMSSQWGYIVVTVNPSLFERFGVRLGVAAEGSAASAASAVGGVNFAAAVTDEHKLGLLFEGRHVGDIRWSNAAAAEDANMGELIKVGQGDRSRLHAAHR